MTTPNPWRHGFTDAIMSRAPCCPWKDYYRQQQYLKGYLHGKDIGKSDAIRFTQAVFSC